jgi:AcrR family transcriptional regulator
MVSQQRNVALLVDQSRPANAIDKDRILDAAYELLLAVGMRRMNMADIARQAEVSRATLYRRWPNVRSVIGALMTREWAVLSAGALVANAPTARAGLVEAVVQMVGAIRSHPLLRKIIEVDPEFLLPYLLQRRGISTNQQLELIEYGVRAGISDGSVRPDRPAMQARSVLLAAWSFALTGPVLTDGKQLRALDEQLRQMLDRYLAP